MRLNKLSGSIAMAILCGLATANAAGISDVSVGMTYPIILGNDYLTYSSRVGVRASLSVRNPEWTQFSWTGTAEYQPYLIAHTSLSMSQLSGYFGAELRGGLNEGFIVRPYVGAQLGLSYQILNFATAGVSTNNTSIYPAFRLNFGFETPSIGPVSFVAETPITMLMSRDSFINYGLHFMLRCKL